MTENLDIILRYDPETGLSIEDESHGVHMISPEFFYRKISVDKDFIERYHRAVAAWELMHEELEQRWKAGRFLTDEEIAWYVSDMKARYKQMGVDDDDVFVHLDENGNPI